MWERATRLIDTKEDAKDSDKADVSRMRSLLFVLKNEKPVKA
jgi:hypothetical protein